ncbi:hypothetical protein [Amycolatopsis sp. NPDC059021]|uniref:hypothetical protein n=1 Tax=Amycolatopsis sp. NPDC059021 TaxID=3346704 RepID=UPI0036711C0D
MVAWDDWANGHGDRALGKITGGLLLFSAGKVAKGVLSKEKHAGGAHTRRTRAQYPGQHPPPEARAERVHDAVTDEGGKLLGVEDGKGVRIISEEQLNQARQRFRNQLGAPTDIIKTPKGTVEYWKISDDPKKTVTCRTYSGSRGATIEINDVSGVDMRQFHMR